MQEISDIIMTYKSLKTEFETANMQFNKFKLEFQKDFESIISELEKKNPDPPSNPQQHSPPIAGNIPIKLREIKDNGKGNENHEGDNVTKAKLTKKINEPVETAKASKKPDIKSKMSKLYRKLCKKLHPDIMDGDDNKFIEVQEKYETEDDLGMIELAIDNDVDITEYVDNNDEIVEFWKKEIQRLRDEISNITKTIPWVWCTSDYNKKQQIKPNIINSLRN